ncbi:inositol hexakisphosphate kinase 3 isoform X1 [Caretta caretta]|uniref:inositol hexakisphosphate kinase 3 isoform X1 n=2 Tax=Caretta caretta TaxID=8467 RepID=UPI0020943E9B|nr:inositol hexakisphosphate kinase 3 isoform X1 [Caretta caretta]XP_048682347.1 inositol hexakisphosphate kinase 3 isoform X1 [Caretta caretta]XP_048682348.1 inositol hexakisphosphate kinase 3 isoform X1 [Caretta caretta]
MVVQNKLDTGDSRKAVLLEPFVHQVGGHMSMMKYDEHTVCKPLISQEQWVYESLPTAIKQFTPQYKGIISVCLRKDSLGNVGLIASPSLPTDNCSSLDKEHSVMLWQEIKRTSTTSSERLFVEWSQTPFPKTIKDSCPGKALFRTELQYHTAISSLMEDTNGNQSERKSYNPWALHCHQLHLNRMSSKLDENKLHQFLLLENVVSKYQYPCILDLKMGTRQHGDDASEEKKARHIKKCEQSTSGSLGVRICGMQVYQADTGQFLCKDKYYGRKLSPDGFRQALYQFLHNGNRLRTDVLEPIVSQLKALLSVIKSQSSYRFYSSSLLIIYDGQEPKENKETLDNHPQGCFQNINRTMPHGTGYPKVDVRMIDFAHTTYKGSKYNHTIYDGPDHGYIFGLENLVKILENTREGE